MSLDSLHGGGVTGPELGENLPYVPPEAIQASSKLAAITGGLSAPTIDPSKVKAEFIERRGGAHRLGGTKGIFARLLGKTDHVQFAESKDVRGMGEKVFKQAEKDMNRYGSAILAAKNMVSQNTDKTFTIMGGGEWEPALDSKDAQVLQGLVTDCGFEADKGGFIHKGTGMRLAILYHPTDKEYSIAVLGLGESIKDKGYFSRLGQVIKDSIVGKSDSTDVAMKLGEKLAETGITCTVSGHSHGGNIAQIIGLTAGARTICFNSRAVSADAQQKLKAKLGEAYQANIGKIVHYNKQGCWVTDNPALSALTKLVAKAKNSEPAQRLGEQYYVPSNQKGTMACHNDCKWPENLKAFPWDTNNENNLIY